VDIDFPAEFADWLDRMDSDAEAGDERARLVRDSCLLDWRCCVIWKRLQSLGRRPLS